MSFCCFKFDWNLLFLQYIKFHSNPLKPKFDDLGSIVIFRNHHINEIVEQYYPHANYTNLFYHLPLLQIVDR